MQLVKPSFRILSDVGPEQLIRIERAGRTCYKSEGKTTETSAPEFCRKLIKRGHLSVLEHESISVRFIIDRGVSHELVRHRLCAFSQESTRWCAYRGDVTFIIPPWLACEPGEYQDVRPDYAIWFNTMLTAEAAYLRLLSDSWTPQQARSVLPNSLKTDIVVTADFREWRHIFTLRCSAAAHPQMREVMIPLRDELRNKIPVVFDAEA